MGRKNSGHQILDKKKTFILIAILAVGIPLIILTSGKGGGKKNFDESILRSEDGESTKVRLIADSVYGEEVIDVEVLSRTYSKEEIEKMKPSFLKDLKLTVLGENESFDSVSSPLDLKDKITGYPFEISYRIRPRGFINSSGEITEYPKEKTDIEIEAEYRIADFEDKEIIHLTLLPEVLPEERVFYEELKRQVEFENENDRNNSEFILPTTINGVDVSWKKPGKNTFFKLTVLTVFCAIVFLFKDKLAFSEDDRKRREKIINDYPEFAMKYALLCEAGLTHAQALERMGDEYLKNKKNSPLYGELYKVRTDIKGGVPVTQALDRMASDCNIREISYFVGLINRNIRKGGREISSGIRKAAGESIRDKREKIRRKAETAGTKLLLPMVFLLIIVFVLIMIPAFDSFSY
ncbi:MAG: type II secretion system F family protein [Lachnospiraceae bacterium]|nr:type II secretion system F family protein [Lachnospiraceae bacterium]